ELSGVMRPSLGLDAIVAERADARARFAVRVSTIFLGLSALGLAVPVSLRWGAHDGGIPGLLMFIVFPWSAGVALIASVVYLVKERSRQAWVEFGLAALLVALVIGMMLL